MEKNPKVTQKLKKALWQVTKGFLLLFLLLLLLVLSLQIPVVQTFVSKQLTSYISKQTGFQTEIERVQIRWWDAVNLKNLQIHDHRDSLMVLLDDVYIDFSLSGLFYSEDASLDQIMLKRGNVRLLSHEEDDFLNIALFFDRLTDILPSRKKDLDREAKKFTIQNIQFERTSLDIIGYGGTPVTSGMDYKNLLFRELYADVDNFQTEGRKISMKVNHLRGTESNSGIEFQQLTTRFTYDPTYLEFDELYLRSNKTEIKDYLRFSFEDVDDLSSFNDRVQILANLDETILHVQDLRYFSPGLPDIDDRIFLSGEIRGMISDLFSEQLLIRFGNRSALFGKFKIDGLPDLDQTFFEMSLMNSVLNSADLTPYISTNAQKELNKFRDIRFDTDFSGYLNFFTANGNFRTGIGNITGRLNYRSQGNTPTYTGRLDLRNLDMGIILEDRENFGKLSMSGTIKGTGTTLETALIDVAANIQQIWVNGYNYSNINTDATYGKDLFSGNLTIRDPNLKARVSGVLDLRDNKDSIRLTAKVDTAFLQEIKLLENDGFISGEVVMDTKGITLDDIEGIARFKDIKVSYEGRDLSVDNFFFQSLFTDNFRLISLNSDLLVASISGNFEVERLLKDVSDLSEEYLAILTNSGQDLPENRPGDFEPYSIDINLNFIDINPIINLIEPRASISKNTLIEGAFYQTPVNTVLNFFSSVDSIYYNGHLFFDNNLDFNSAKRVDNHEVLAAFYIFSKNQELSNGLSFSNLALEAIWDETNIDVTYQQDQPATNSYVKIKNEITLSPGKTLVVFEPSELKILDKVWQFDADNFIEIKEKNISVNNLKLFYEDQYLALDGKISPDERDILRFAIHEVNMDFINTLSTREYSGLANGNFGLDGFYQTIGINGNISIDDLYINNFLVGNLEAATFYEEKKVNFELNNYRLEKNVISISGFLGSENQELDLLAKLNEADLSVMEPFLSNYLTEMGGEVSGDLKIEGSLAFPEVVGVGKLSGGQVRVNYLNTFYVIDGDVVFEPNEISFQRLTLMDVNGNSARLRGGISHDYFSSFVLDIRSNLENFQVLNTGAKDNEVFYGTAYATGTLDIFGAANNLDINARAVSQAETRIYIPFGSNNVQAQEDYINIINVRDTLKVVDLERQVEKLAINNVRMNFILDITPDTYAEIQIDPRTGENIQGRGRGVLTLGIDTEGNFTMTGNYEITEAKYNFSLYNIIRKEFIVEPQSRISWFGDPYEGIMDIKAYYQENISLQALQPPQNTGQEDPMMRRRFPVKVLMNLQGNLLSPDIIFNFDFSEFPTEGNTQNYISAFLNRIANDEQEKNRQVFSVIMMRSLSPEGQFSGVGNIATSNLSQLLSSQLNSFIAQVDQNLEVDIDLASLDEDALETFQLRVAYTFLDGRLRVSRDGGFTDLQGNADLNSIAGDWQAEYLLTEDGRYRMRIYNRNNFTTWTSLSIARNVATYGVSFSQNLSFNSFGELWNKITKNKNDKLRVNDTDDFLRQEYEENMNWQPIPLENLEEKVERSQSFNRYFRKEEDH